MSTPSAAPFELARFVPYRLAVLASRVAKTFASRHAARFGLSIPEWRTMMTVGRHPGCSSAWIGETTEMDKAKVSRAVTLLTAKGLLDRQDGPRDQRQNRLALTEAGQAMHDRILPIALALEQELLDALSRTERARFLQILGKLETRIARMAESASPDLVDRDPHI